MVGLEAPSSPVFVCVLRYKGNVGERCRVVSESGCMILIILGFCVHCFALGDVIFWVFFWF